MSAELFSFGCGRGRGVITIGTLADELSPVSLEPELPKSMEQGLTRMFCGCGKVLLFKIRKTLLPMLFRLPSRLKLPFSKLLRIGGGLLEDFKLELGEGCGEGTTV